MNEKIISKTVYTPNGLLISDRLHPQLDGQPKLLDLNQIKSMINRALQQLNPNSYNQTRLAKFDPMGKGN